MNKLSNIALAGCAHPQAQARIVLNVLIACEVIINDLKR